MFETPSAIAAISRAARDRSLRGRVALQAARETITYGDLIGRIERISGALLARGLRRGGRVGLLAGRSVDAAAGVFGIMTAGGAVCVLDPHQTPAETRARLASAEISWVLADEAHAGAAADSSPRELIRIEDTASARPRALDDLGPDDDALLVCTTGSTGVSKAVLLTHGNLLSNARGVAGRTGVTPADRVLHMLPLYHTNGVNNLLLVPFGCGAAVLMLDHFRAETFFDEIAALRPTYVTGVATHYSRLLRYPPPRGALASLRFLRSGAAPLSAQLHREVERHLGLPLIHSYGLSEATCTVAMNPPGARRIGTVGTVLAGQHLVVFAPATETPVPAGTEGEICVAGASLMKGYVPPAAGADGPSIRNGWLRTGDLGWMDGDGYLTVSGRLKEIIIRGGENLSPGRIEEAILRHPAVRACCVIGAPHADLGEVPVAFIVVHEGLAAPESVIRGQVAAELPRACVPARVITVEALPEIGIGKIDRKALKQLAVNSRINFPG